MRVLFKNGTVVSGKGTRRADVLVDGEKIRRVAREIHVDDAQIVDAAGMLLMPGFIDAHALNTYPGTWRKEGGAKTEGNIIDEEYKEGIYVGYRWTDKKNIKPAFAFGHGLSYTQFAISNLRSDKNLMNQNDSITFTVNVKNTGKRAGAETIQLYIHDVKASVDRPYKELKGFQKVYLQPGESKDVNITINKQALSFYDETAASWKAEAGKFEALVGNASDQLKLKKTFELK